MRTVKNLLKLVLVAVLSLAFAISVAACNTGSKPGNDIPGGNTEIPGGTDPDGETPDDSVKYTVEFKNVDSGAYPSIKVSKNGTVSVESPKRDDAIFLGWYMDEECTALPFTVGATKITQNTVLYAKWKTKTVGEETKRYTVTFNSDGGNDVATQSVEEGGCAFKVTPERAGYRFLGWYLGDSKYDFNNVITQNITLIAKWSDRKSVV